MPDSQTSMRCGGKVSAYLPPYPTLIACLEPIAEIKVLCQPFTHPALGRELLRADSFEISRCQLQEVHKQLSKRVF